MTNIMLLLLPLRFRTVQNLLLSLRFRTKKPLLPLRCTHAFAQKTPVALTPLEKLKAGTEINPTLMVMNYK
ncbi:hypothetical protein [Lysinibacillus sphaericus]|uniref:hypothetical protein n=1 Tax=Lysinibacillus sphaericus TaxID=1421 RepID=UPI0018CF2170|nr:hypothetical protein [Lysinibacillus sphaericus]